MVVDWASLKTLGDEQDARQAKWKDGREKAKDLRLDDYRRAVRANRQLALALREQGLNEEADHFAYRAQQLQRVVLRRQGSRFFLHRYNSEPFRRCRELFLHNRPLTQQSRALGPVGKQSCPCRNSVGFVGILQKTECCSVVRIESVCLPHAL